MNDVIDPPADSMVSNVLENAYELEPLIEENGYEDLLKIGLTSLAFTPPLYFTSIFGPTNQWFPPHRADSEYTILDFWKPAQSLNYLLDINIPAFHHIPPPLLRTLLPPFLQKTFWRPSGYFQQPDPFASTTSFNKEHWFFINGVATNKAVAKINSGLLSKLFRRPITVIHNQTDSLLLDLYQCAVGKQFKTNPRLSQRQTMTEPTFKATVAILEALKDPEREKVVVLCHSQGTIIASNVLKAIHNCFSYLQSQPEKIDSSEAPLNSLEKVALNILLDEKKQTAEPESNHQDPAHLIHLLKKLEFYTFANCADTMTYVTHIPTAEGMVGLPYIENFANQFDLVARLGVLSPYQANRDSNLIRIDGPIFEKQGQDAWGHLLNQHYLFGIQAHLDAPKHTPNPYPQQNQQQATQPRLYGYFSGGRPASYYR